MKIQYCSDLHLEFDHNNRYLKESDWEVSAEVLILAGDIAPLHDRYLNDQFFSFLSTQYSEIFWVPGNHEFYHRDLNDFSFSFHHKIRPNIHLLQNMDLVYEGVRFVFSTLWTHLSAAKMSNIEKGIADFSTITKRGKLLNGTEYNQLHQESLSYLKNAIEESTEPTVVITHHLPSASCNSPEHKESLLNEAYCVDLSDYITGCNADFWIYGHSHYNQKPMILGKTVLLTNQLGMVLSGEHASFRKTAFFSV